MRFQGTAYRAHDPRWSFLPLSGDGAALHGGRFNPKGVPALYMGLSPIAAIKEANQGLAFKIEPLLLCSYIVDCNDVEDLTNADGRRRNGVTADDLACGWFAIAAEGEVPPTWDLATRLIGKGVAGVIVPSFAPGAEPTDHNLVLWAWASSPPHHVEVHDPSGRLPKDQLSWPK